MVDSAVRYVKPNESPRKNGGSDEDPNLRRLAQILADARNELPAKADPRVLKLFDRIEKRAGALFNSPRRSTGIEWTDATWNPLEGCKWASKGCDYCYAAKLAATRLKDVYPGLAEEKIVKGERRYFFSGKIILVPDRLGEPLRDRTPRKYFVNSMSDLFHKDVPDEFIEAVFQVMEKAPWHRFQVLTKRPERMADFTRSYFRHKSPPAHVWLGTSTENQEAFDKRYPQLKKVKAAVRWLSCEPLLGQIKISDFDAVDWVVVGGESKSRPDRKMNKSWATSLRDQCRKAKVPFFFKQWGDYGEDGEE